jgi:hypothetical protein
MAKAATATKTTTKPEEPKKTASTAVAEVKSAALAVSQADLDAMYEEDSGKGTSTDMADNVIPILKVIQSLTPQALKQKPEYIKGCEAGQIWARGTKDIWPGEEGVRIVPVCYERIWLEWGAKRGDGLKGRHRKGNDDTPRLLGAELKTDSEGNEKWTLPNGHTLQDCREHVVLLLDKYDTPKPFVLPMSGSNIGTSRNWHPMMNDKTMQLEIGKVVKAASYAYVYGLKTMARSNDDGDWFQMAIEDTRERTTPEVYLHARRINADFAGGKLVADTDTEQGGGASSGSDDDNKI